MKITAINASPKEQNSMTSGIISQLERLLPDEVNSCRTGDLKNEADLSSLTENDVLIFVFPLYVDSLPASLIELLTRLEKIEKTKKPLIYAVTNCGFYEAQQTYLALAMMKCFANKAGLQWGYGLGIGAGPMIQSFGENWQYRPTALVYQALVALAERIKDRKTSDDRYVTVKFSRFLYGLSGNMGWYSLAYRNKTKNLMAKPHKEGK